MDTNTIRQRLQAQGWQIRELPIRKNQTIRQWKLIAFKGEKSIEAEGKTLLEAMETVGKTLGVIAR